MVILGTILKIIGIFPLSFAIMAVMDGRYNQSYILGLFLMFIITMVPGQILIYTGKKQRAN